MIVDPFQVQNETLTQAGRDRPLTAFPTSLSSQAGGLVGKAPLLLSPRFLAISVRCG
jgi:hypothetical protein